MYFFKKQRFFIIVSLFFLLTKNIGAQEKIVKPDLPDKTRLVMLGTGHPGFDHNRAGQAILLVHQKKLFQFDAGPGYMKNYEAFSNRPWMPKDVLFSNDSVYGQINKLFITHLDSDHVLGLDEFLLRPWVQGRSEPVLIVGPKGIKKMVDKILDTYQEDINHRLYGSQPANENGFKAKVIEIDNNQVVYQDNEVKVEAFKVPHGSWPDGMAFGYRITTPDKTIVLSGDTRFDESNFNHYRNADIVVHEVMSEKGVSRLSSDWQKYMYHAHTSTTQLAKLANEVKPKLLVLNHVIFFGVNQDEILQELGSHYTGKVVLADDLMTF